MSMPITDGRPKSVMLELTARHHAGVMSQVCGLLARRAYPTDGLLCLPLEDGRQCRFWLRVPDDTRLPNLIEQLRKLEDVLEVHQGMDWQPHQALAQLTTWFQ